MINIQDKNKILNFFLEITNNDKKQISYIQNLLEVYPNILEYMVNDQMPDLSAVKYVKYKRYNMLKEKVLLHVDILELNSLLNDSFDISILKQLRNMFIDKVPYIFMTHSDINNLILNLIKKSPYDTLCNIDGIGFIRADKILLEAYSKSPNLWDFNIRTSNHRCKCFIIWYLLNGLNGSIFTTKNKLIQIMLYKYHLNECVNSIDEALTDARFYVDNDKVMLKISYLEEKNISNYIKSALNVEKNKYNLWDIDIDKYSTIDNFNLTNEQKTTLDLVNKNQLVLLNGYAGTGKSSSIKALINMLEDNNKTYRMIAPTAKAAKQLSNYTERPASTIHYLLAHDFPSINTGINISEYALISNIDYDNINDKNNDFLNYDILIIDESSMLSIKLFNLLLKFINPTVTKILLIGDSYQLPSIQSGNLYQDLLLIEDIPKITLNTIFRYTEDGLVNVATNIRLGRQFLNNEPIQHIGNSYSFYEFNNINEMLNAALNKYMNLLQDGNNIEDIAILTAKNVGNSGTYIINSCIQKIINPISEFDDYITITVDQHKIKFKENDVVMNIKNNYNAVPLNDSNTKMLIANGQTGVIKSVNSLDNTLIVDIDGIPFEFEYQDIRNLRLAYCFTIHKSQGSQFKNVIYLTSIEDGYMTNANLEYVAVTRAQDNCYHFGSKLIVNKGLMIKENLKRDTTLIEQYYDRM